MRNDNPDQMLDMLLAKKRAADRREWLESKGNLARISHEESRELNFEGVEKEPLKSFAERAYLDYSMYVILDRALPHIGDGLKPVQRRIVYAMSELGLAAGAKHKKSARTVGDVIGKFHPHGDSACYEAMVHMAQDFAYRYPIVDGQGNWGSTDDPKSFAAMRYTESRLTRYAALLLQELGFEHGRLGAELRRLARRADHAAGARAESAAERRLRASRSAWPPTFRRTICAKWSRPAWRCSTIRTLSTRKIMAHIKGPDLPTGGGDRLAARRSWCRCTRPAPAASRRARPMYIEDGEIVIEALPFQVSGSKVLEQIADQMRQKKLPMVEDLRDESDHEKPTRLVIVPKSNRVDTAGADGAPVRDHRPRAQLPRQSQRHRARRPAAGDGPEGTAAGVAAVPQGHGHPPAEPPARPRSNARLHILDGLLIAYLNLDEVIRIVRTEEQPKPVLIKRFKLSDDAGRGDTRDQAAPPGAARGDENPRRADASLTEERDEIEAILKSKARLTRLVRDELVSDAEEYGDERRTRLVEREAAQAISEDGTADQRADHRGAVAPGVGARGQGARHRCARA